MDDVRKMNAVSGPLFEPDRKLIMSSLQTQSKKSHNCITTTLSHNILS
jgi:hypothetical protein